ncbi:MAG: VanZ family protein [Bacteroidales bacterium]|nr:VanZ family protein [Bacteroidales bacterium]
MRNNKILNYWKPLLVAIIILYGSITSGNTFNKVAFIHFKHIDKIVHCIFYLSLSSTLLASIYKNTRLINKSQIVSVFIISILYGILMEYLQYKLTTTRTADFIDVISNVFGTILGYFVFIASKKLKVVKYL